MKTLTLVFDSKDTEEFHFKEITSFKCKPISHCLVYVNITLIDLMDRTTVINGMYEKVDFE